MGYFTRIEKFLCIGSIIILIALYFYNDNKDPLTLLASIIGAIMLIFLAKGNPLGQILTIVFSLLYGYISYKSHYYGEMITYLGMTAPSALVGTIAWIKNPYGDKIAEVKINKVSKKQVMLLLILTIFVTIIFYYILKYFNTYQLVISTFSIFTSFFASGLTILRSPYYALAYSLNDIVLVFLWIYATILDGSKLPMIICFLVFLVNDIYGFINWKKMERIQRMKL